MKRYKVTIKEKNTDHEITQTAVCQNSQQVIEWYGLNDSDIEWYKIDEI